MESVSKTERNHLSRREEHFSLFVKHLHISTEESSSKCKNVHETQRKEISTEFSEGFSRQHWISDLPRHNFNMVTMANLLLLLSFSLSRRIIGGASWHSRRSVFSGGKQKCSDTRMAWSSIPQREADGKKDGTYATQYLFLKSVKVTEQLMWTCVCHWSGNWKLGSFSEAVNKRESNWWETSHRPALELLIIKKKFHHWSRKLFTPERLPSPVHVCFNASVTHVSSVPVTRCTAWGLE